MVVHAGAVGQYRHRASVEDRQLNGLADQGLSLFSSQGTERVVGVGDAAMVVAAHDQVALRLQQTARALLGFAQLPIPVGQFLNAGFEVAQFPFVSAAAHQHHRDDGAGAGEQ